MTARLRRDYQPVPIGENRFAFYGEWRVIDFDHPAMVSALRAIVPLLDGASTLEQVVRCCGVTERFAIETLAVLNRHRLLEDPSGNPLGEEGLLPLSALVGELTSDPERAVRRVQEARPWVIGTGRLPALVATAMGECGVRGGSLTVLGGPTEELPGWEAKPFPVESLRESLDGVSLLVTALDRAWVPFLSRINRAVIDSGTIWVPVILQGTQGMLGPTVVPRDTACYTCLRLRTLGNFADAALHLRLEEQQSLGAPPPAAVTLPPFERALAGHTALEAFKLLSGLMTPQSVGRLLEFDAEHSRTFRQDVLKLPRCPACGVSRPPVLLWDEHTTVRAES
jgi:bacteriocin biosynthesis cyclodehydratase domain-containing protein